MDKRCFIFPNRRSRAFFAKYLSECVKEAGTPVMMPLSFTINDFFKRISRLETADRVSQLLLLYDIYKDLNDRCESLDEFIFWGDVILGDFDDVDKYLVDPGKLFTNVSEFKDMQDSFSYLSESQWEAVNRFVSHFRKGGSLAVDPKAADPGVKGRFLMLWEILLPLYNRFREALSARGLSYEGMIYRAVADSLKEQSAVDLLSRSFKDGTQFVFVGLNALNECEKKLMDRMRDAGVAQFCWDYTSDMIRDPRNKSSFFMKENVTRFPQAFTPDPGGLGTPRFRVISVPSAVGQAKQLPRIFSEIGTRGIDTAVVLPDESLLIPVLNTIPSHIDQVNVTMGYPMKESELFALMSDVAAMQLHVRQNGEDCRFYHKQVHAIFSNSLFKAALDGQAEECVSRVKADAKYYIPIGDLSCPGIMELVFRPAGEKTGQYLLSVVSAIAVSIKNDPEMALELDFAKEYYMAVRSLERNSLPVKQATYFKLLEQITASMSVPFNGEPLKGLQIMGPLETRALDFEHVVILSCNEGVFPRRSVSSSFIPPELRRGFGLPTFEYQDAVWAYYFYRMIQRASDVTLLFDSRTEGLKSGEESRYIGQLDLHFGVELERSVAKAAISSQDLPTDIPKTEEDVVKLKSLSLSPSSLRNYLSCEAMFYFGKILGLKAEEEISEALDNNMTGNVFHKAMQALYSAGPRLSREYLASVLAGKDRIKSLVRSLIAEELKTVEVTGRNLIFEDMLVKYVLRTVESDLALLKTRGLDSLTILGLEKPMEWRFAGFRFAGIIDRLDSLDGSSVRVIDYKTGKVGEDDINITDDNAEKIASLLFGEKNQGRPGIALQLFLYDMFVRSDPAFEGKELVNSIYHPAMLSAAPPPEAPLSREFCRIVEGYLAEMLENMSDPSRPWRRKADAKTCQYCDFKKICGR